MNGSEQARQLLPHHRASLEASAIAPDVIGERPYSSARNKAELLSLGLAPSQRLAPALVCPLRWPGLPDLAQIKPDDPRPDKDKPGKTIKYETPFGATLHADCPPRCWPMLADASIPLVVTEGIKKGDALATVGVCAVALPGAWGAVRRKQGGDHELRPEWANVALRGRRVYLCFDSDVSRKGEVAAALNVLLTCLKREGADVWIVYLPDGPDGQKVGADDFLAAGHGLTALYALATQELRHFSHFSHAQTPWDEPVPLGEYALPRFPAEALPPVFGDFVSSLADSLQMPADVPGTLILAAGAAAVQGRVEVDLGAWREQISLYVAPVYPSAGRKTAAVAAITAPLEAWEREQNTTRREEIAAAEAEARILQAGLNEKEKTAAKSGVPADLQTARDAARQLEAFRVPTPVRLLCEDATPEALPGLMAANGGRMASFSAEGDVFDIIAGRHSDKGPSLGVYLKAYDGEPIRVDRVGRKGDTVDRPALTLALCVQPDVLRGLMKTPTLRGRGFLARWLFALPMPNIGYREVDTEAVSEPLRERYAATIRLMLRRVPDETPDGTTPAPLTLRLSDEAGALFRAFRQRIEKDLRPAGTLCSLQDWGGKVAGKVARIAGILHLADARRTEEPITGEMMASAITLGDYFTEHARAAFAEMGADADLDGARALRDWMLREGEPSFTHRDAHRAHQSRFKRAADMDAPLAILEERGWIRRSEPPKRETGQKGRPPLPGYDVNPFALDKNDKTDKTPSPADAERVRFSV